MEIITKGHDFRFEVEQIMFLFFQRIKDAKIVSEMTVFENQYTVTSEVFASGEEGYDSFSKQFDSPDEKALSNFVKQSAYRAAKKISKIGTPWGIMTGVRPAKNVREFFDMGLSEDEIKGILKDEYYLEDSKIELAIEVAKNEIKTFERRLDDGVSIYIGIPFCPTRCLYCSFVSNSMHRAGEYLDRYVDLMIDEIRYTAKIASDMGWRVQNVYFGGGTPTTLDPYNLERLFFAVSENFDLSNVDELTVEAGRPDTIDEEKLKVLKKYKVSRLSINPQSMNQRTLDEIGRAHTPEDIKKAFYLARSAGFDNINSDIIAGLPNENTAMFENTLNEMAKLKPEAITIHTMYIKRASRLKEELEEHVLAETEEVRKMLELGQKFMGALGLKPYYMYKQKNTLGNFENVGYSKPGYEGLYNIFIMEEIQTILAIGAGAVTKMVREGRIERIFNLKNITDYIKRFDEMLKKKDKIYEFFS